MRRALFATLLLVALAFSSVACGTGSISPAIPDRLIFTVNNSPDYITAVSTRDGSQLWKTPLHSLSAPTPISDGTVYVVDGELLNTATLDAVRASDGKLLWSVRPQISGTSYEIRGTHNAYAAAVVTNGIVAIIVDVGNMSYVYAFRASDGQAMWHVSYPDFGDKINIEEFTADDGMIFTTTDGSVSALRANDGHWLWTDSLSVSSEALDAKNGIIALNTTTYTRSLSPDSGIWDQKVVALRERDGALMWSHVLHEWSDFTPLPQYLLVEITPDSVLASYYISFSTQDSLQGEDLSAVGLSDGVQKWRHHYTGENVTGPAMIGTTVAVLPTQTGLVAYSQSSEKQIWHYQTPLTCFALNGPYYTPDTLESDVLFGTPTNCFANRLFAVRMSTGKEIWNVASGSILAFSGELYSPYL